MRVETRQPESSFTQVLTDAFGSSQAGDRLLCGGQKFIGLAAIPLCATQ